MSRAVKAALLSALVFPGLGHLYLKRRLVGAALAIVSMGSLYLLFAAAADTAARITRQIQQGAVPLDAAAITRLIAEQPTGGDSGPAGVAGILLAVCWLVGIVDAWRLGRARDGSRGE